jgi:hypothetical protein
VSWYAVWSATRICPIPDENGDLSASILDRGDIDQSGEVVQKPTSLVAQIIGLLPADSVSLIWAVEIGDLARQRIDVVDPAPNWSIKGNPLRRQLR